MSLIHNIITKRPLDISRLNSIVLKIDNATYEEKGEGTYYYWIEGKSTRGFDITIEGEVVEVRNTVLSNRHDYELTNIVVKELLKLTDGIILNEEEEQVKHLPLFDNKRIIEAELHDCELIQALSQEHEDIAIYGPTRKVHFGKRLHNTFKSFSRQQLKNKIFETILVVNYELPDFEYGNIMQVGSSDGNKKIIKLLANETDYIIDKYDYILLNTLEQKPIMITNEILNSILPSNWTLVDEFTIVAPIIDKDEWANLLKKAKKYDLWDSFNNN